MAEVAIGDLVSLVEESLCQVHGTDSLSSPVTENSKMGEPEEWDSLSFIVIFTAVAAKYDVELADDDAFHFTSIPAMHAFLNEIL